MAIKLAEINLSGTKCDSHGIRPDSSSANGGIYPLAMNLWPNMASSKAVNTDHALLDEEVLSDSSLMNNYRSKGCETVNLLIHFIRILIFTLNAIGSIFSCRYMFFFFLVQIYVQRMKILLVLSNELDQIFSNVSWQCILVLFELDISGIWNLSTFLYVQYYGCFLPKIKTLRFYCSCTLETTNFGHFYIYKHGLFS